MSFIYAVALVAFCFVLLAVLVEAVLSVSRKPLWGDCKPSLTVVETADRRQQSLPFVGADRRGQAEEPPAAEQHKRVA